VLAATAATLLGACVSTDYKESFAKGACVGVNSCKGTSNCATATTSCKGQNACKGQGFLLLSRSDCAASDGTFVQ
jgi:hypothetical protein